MSTTPVYGKKMWVQYLKPVNIPCEHMSMNPLQRCQPLNDFGRETSTISSRISHFSVSSIVKTKKRLWTKHMHFLFHSFQQSCFQHRLIMSWKTPGMRNAWEQSWKSEKQRVRCESVRLLAKAWHSCPMRESWHVCPLSPPTKKICP